MKKNLFILLVFMFSGLIASGQCTIDSTQTIPGIYPMTPPNPQVGVYYNQDLTIVFPTETLSLQILSIQLDSIIGDIPGLTYTCNSPLPNCTYYPNQSIWGCINVSGTPQQAGLFIVTIKLIVDIQVVGIQNISLTLWNDVNPGILNNPGFQMQPDTGCPGLISSVQNAVAGEFAYSWDFGNGDTSLLEQPGTVQYNSSGTYIVKREIVPQPGFRYYLMGLTVNSLPNAYSDGFNDIADLYIKLTDTTGFPLNTKVVVNNQVTNVNFDIDTVLLNNELYTVEVWDQDQFLGAPDDSLGVISFNGWSNSGNATSVLAGSTGILDVSYTIQTVPIAPVINYDTVYIYSLPSIPVINNNNDTLTTTYNASYHYQWNLNGQPVGNDTNIYIATSSGSYTVTISDVNGCTATSVLRVITDVQNYTMNGNFKCYPNPSAGIFYVESKRKLISPGVITLTDQQGRILDNQIIPAGSSAVKLEFSSLETGAYRLLIKDEKGQSEIPLMIIH
jgi:Secretion system C-terminal sorting domain